MWETPFKFHIEPKSSSTWNWEREGKFDVIYSHSDRGRKEFSRRRNHEFKGTKIPFTLEVVKDFDYLPASLEMNIRAVENVLAGCALAKVGRDECQGSLLQNSPVGGIYCREGL